MIKTVGSRFSFASDSKVTDDKKRSTMQQNINGAQQGMSYFVYLFSSFHYFITDSNDVVPINFLQHSLYSAYNTDLIAFSLHSSPNLPLKLSLSASYIVHL